MGMQVGGQAKINSSFVFLLRLDLFFFLSIPVTGKNQPYNPGNGYYLPYSANPGAAKSPFMYFSKGFSEGFLLGFSGA